MPCWPATSWEPEESSSETHGRPLAALYSRRRKLLKLRGHGPGAQVAGRCNGRSLCLRTYLPCRNAHVESESAGLVDANRPHDVVERCHGRRLALPQVVGLPWVRGH